MADDLFTRARTEGSPIIEGDRATFVWRGPNPPVVLGDFVRWRLADAPQLAKIGPNLWAHTLTLPRDAYVEYIFSRRVNPPRPPGEEVRLPDPLNKRRVLNGQGKYSHFFYMPEAEPSPWRKRPKGGVPALTTHTLEHPDFLAGGKRTVSFYRPPGKSPCPLLVVFDGPDYVRRAQLVNIVDNLIAAKRMRPVALALLANGKQARVLEYGTNDITLNWVLKHVVPLARKELHLVDPEKHPGAYSVLGASIGGLMALYAGLRAPQVFGQVLAQSGTFALDDYDMAVYDFVRDMAPRPLKIWLDVGRMERLLDTNRRMHALLQKRGYAVTYREFSAGHNFTAWADDVAHGLEAVFG